MKDGIPVADYKWIFDERQPKEEFQDGDRMVTITFHKKVPMISSDYMTWKKRGMISKEEYEKCLQRPIWESKENKKQKEKIVQSD